MFMLAGVNFYGKIDRVPGLFYTATQFIHIFYIPLIPMGAHLVIEEPDDVRLRSTNPIRSRAADTIGFLVGGQQYRSAKLGFNFRSLIYAWANIAIIVFAFFGVLGINKILQDVQYWRANNYWSDYNTQTPGLDLLYLSAMVLGCIAALWVLRRTSYASEARALEIGRGVGISDDVVLAHVRGGG